MVESLRAALVRVFSFPNAPGRLAPPGTAPWEAIRGSYRQV